MPRDRSPPFFAYFHLGGAYVLEMDVRDVVSTQVGSLGRLDFTPGQYFYVGSAYGPGGIAARVARHLKRGRRHHHWHIDYLITLTAVQRVWVIPKGNECGIVSTLLRDTKASTPFAGFGSSDCTKCSAHLLTCTTHLTLDDLLAGDVSRFNTAAWASL